MVASLFRQNGLLFVFVVCAALWFVVRPERRRLGVCVVASVALVVMLKAVVYPIADIASSGSQPALAPMLHDIAAVATNSPQSFDADDRALLASVAPFEQWRQDWQSFGCSTMAWAFRPGFAWREVDGQAADFAELWVRLATDHPLAIARNRMCISAIGWRPDTVGFLYTVSAGIDANNLGLDDPADRRRPARCRAPTSSRPSTSPTSSRGCGSRPGGYTSPTGRWRSPRGGFAGRSCSSRGCRCWRSSCRSSRSTPPRTPGT